MSNPVILMPMRTLDDLHPETARALEKHTGPHTLIYVTGLPVDQARNHLAATVLAMESPPEFVVWVDSDAFWQEGAIEKLIRNLQANPHLSMLACSCTRREPGTAVVAWRRAGEAESALKPALAGTPGANCVIGDLVEIEACGLHGAALRTDALRDVGPEPFNVTDEPEDLAFCRRLKKRGHRIACATGIMFGHLDSVTGLAFAAGAPPGIVENGVWRQIESTDMDGLEARGGLSIDRRRDGAVLKLAAETRRSFGAAVDHVAALASKVEQKISPKRSIRAL